MEELVKRILEGICWKGYKRKKGTEPYAKGSCEKIKEDKDAATMQKAKSEALLKKGGLTDDEKKFHEKKANALSQYLKKQVKENFISAAPKPSSSPMNNQHNNAVKNKPMKKPITKPMTPKSI